MSIVTKKFEDREFVDKDLLMLKMIASNAKGVVREQLELFIEAKAKEAELREQNEDEDNSVKV